MASIIGVSSMYSAPTLVESYRRVSTCTSTASTASSSSTTITTTATTTSLPFQDKSHFGSALRAYSKKGGSRLGVSLVASAIATPNSVLSEEAFKGLGDFEEDSLDVSDEDEYESEGEAGSDSVDGDELAVAKLGLPTRLVETLERRGITSLFPIQRAVLVPALEGRDIIARAKTGTGKTLAFGIPIIKRLTEDDEQQRGSQRRSGRLPRVLVLAPTRELAKQVEKEIKESATHLSTVCVYGGVSYVTQQSALSRGVDVVVGTPGRIIDLINGKSLKLGEVQFLVLDEADQMLAVGFEEDVELILEQLPTQRQSMLFSATMPGWVKKLSRKHLDNPMTIDLVGEQDEKLAEGIKLYALSTTATSKRTILGDLITVYAKGGKTIVFTQTKRDADEVSMSLTNSIASEALHGDISQHQRERTLNGFRQGKFTVLVATDVASRGLDIPNVDLVIHYELPNDPETFVHRSGRTGRAGKEGSAILMFTSNQRRTIRSLERDVGCKFEFVSPPSIDEVLGSSADHVVATLSGVHPESIKYFTPTAQKLIDEQGTDALAAAIAQLSGFSRPPSSRSLINHEQGWVTLQLTRDPAFARGFLSARSVTGFLSDVYSVAADEVGKIFVIADERADLSKPETIPVTLVGIHTVIDCATGRPEEPIKTVDWEGKVALIQCAKAMGIKKFVFFSIHNCDKHPEVPLMEIKYCTEKFIQESGLDHLTIRLCGFMQGLIGQYAVPILEEKSVWGTDAPTRIAYMDTQDVARLTFIALRNENLNGKLLTFAGPRAWTTQEVITLCERLAGQDANVTTVPVSILRVTRQLTRLFQWTNDVADRLAFSEVLSSDTVFSAPMTETYNLLGVDSKDIISLEKYLQDYFTNILKKLKDLKAQSKQTDIYF